MGTEYAIETTERGSGFHDDGPEKTFIMAFHVRHSEAEIRDLYDWLTGEHHEAMRIDAEAEERRGSGGNEARYRWAQEQRRTRRIVSRTVSPWRGV